MALKKVSMVATEQHQGQRLDQVLAEWLPKALGQPLSKAKVRKLVVAGAVYLNSKRIRIASKAVLRGARVEAYVDLAKLNAIGDVLPGAQGIAGSVISEKNLKLTVDHILYEDEDLIVIDKPAGLPTQPTLDEARANLFRGVKELLAKRDGKAVGEVYLGLHHRLDRDTSGIVLFTKTQRANSGVAALFSKHTAVKVYQALAFSESGEELPGKWNVKNHLGRVPSPGKKAKFGAVRSGGDFAHTDFELLEKFDASSGGKSGSVLHVQATLHTGRTHQIRVHLSGGGSPILGDPFYGGLVQLPGKLHTVRIPRLLLHAASLSFAHPMSGKEMFIRSPLPLDFKNCLSEIKKR